MVNHVPEPLIILRVGAYQALSESVAGTVKFAWIQLLVVEIPFFAGLIFHVVQDDREVCFREYLI